MDGINIDRLVVIQNGSEVVKDQWTCSETTEF